MRSDKVIDITFKPKARLMHLLGENLIRDEVTALLELVKNAHDADAPSCTVRFESINTDEAKIIIEDTGIGMDAPVVTTAWVEPGTSYKKRKPVTPLGRRVQGEKGIGRFAVDKLAKRLDMYTRTENMTDVIHFTVDWEEFDNPDKYLEDVHAQYSFEKMNFRKKGTTLILTHLRKKWDRFDITRVRYGLTRLIPPAGLPDKFSVNLEVPDYPYTGGIVRNDIMSKAPFRVQANLENGLFKVSIYRNLSWDKSTQEKEVVVQGLEKSDNITSEELKSLGPITVEIGAFLKKKRGKSLSTLFPHVSITDADAEILSQWNGVSIYSDGFWIYPYGEDWFDWLGLDQRRVQQPGGRFDNKQIMGFINISRDKNPGLVQQINREGLVHNESYNLLKSFVLAIVGALESDAIASGARKGQKKIALGSEVSASSSAQSISSSFKIVEKLLDDATDKLKTGESAESSVALRKAADGVKNLQVEVEREAIMYNRLSVLGQFVGYVIHEINLNMDPLRLRVDAIKNYILSPASPPGETNPKIPELLQKLDKDIDNLGEQIHKWAPFIKKNEVKQAVEFGQYLNDIRSDIAKIHPKLKVDVVCHEPITLQLTKSDIWTIVNNLVDNSSYWTKDEKEPYVKITVLRDDGYVILRISDNGLGVIKEDLPNIFIPGWSAKLGGSGVGLKLAGESAWNLGGELFLLPDSELGKGATFELRIPVGEYP